MHSASAIFSDTSPVLRPLFVHPVSGSYHPSAGRHRQRPDPPGASTRTGVVSGANGVVDNYCIMRYVNNLESVYTYEGTHGIHGLIIGERITSLPAYF